MKSSTARYTYVSAAVLLILGAWGLRLYHLGVLSLWIDEGFSWEVARQGPGAIFALLAAEDRHPPLHYLLLWLTMRVAGQTEFALRFLSAGVGLLAIPLVYRLGRDLGQPIAGAIASALLAVNPFHVWYSQEARMYALLTTLGLASLWFWLRIVEGAAAEAGPDALRRRPLAVAGYVGTTTAALYTHYYAVFFLLVEVAVAAILLGRSVPAFPAIGRRAVPNVVTDVPEGGRWARLNPVGLLVLPPLLFTPWLPAMAQQYRRAGPGYQPDLSLVGVLGQVTTNYIVGDWTTYGGIFVVVVVVVALLGVLPPWGKTLDRPENGRGVPSSCSGPILLVAAFAAPLAAYLITVLTGIDLRATGRMYYLPGVPPFLLLVGRGLVWIGGAAARLVECPPHPLPPLRGHLERGGLPASPPTPSTGPPGRGVGGEAGSRPPHPLTLIALVGLVAVVAGTTPYLTHQYVARLKQDFRAAADYVQQHEWPGDAVILDAEYIFRPFSYYYHGDAPWYRANVEPDAFAAALTKETGGHERVWLVLSHDGFADPDHRVQGWLDQHGVELDEAWFEGVHLRLYAMDPQSMLARPDVGRPLDFRFGSVASLVGVDLPSSAPGGKDLHLRLVWHDLARIREDLHAALLLTGPDGHVWWQADHAPISPYDPPTRWQPGAYLIDRYDLPLPLGLPAGPYQLAVKLYSPRTGQALPVSGQPFANLGTIQVGPTRLDGPRPGTDAAPGLRLIASSLDHSDARPGDVVTADLTWEATAPTTGGTAVQLLGPGGVVATTTARPFASPVAVGAALREPVALRVPARASAGIYSIRVGPTGAIVGTLRVAAIARSYALPSPRYAQTATLRGPDSAPIVRLDGYDLSGISLLPGGSLRLTLYWQALAEDPTDYTVFTHLIGPDGRIHAQQDGVPASGQRPTSGWLKGEFVRDGYDLTVDPKAAPGSYYLEVGMYRPDTGVRLSTDGGTAIILRERIQIGQAR